MSAIVKRQEEFERLGVMLSLSNQESVNISNNKLHTYLRLQEAKIPVPKFYPVYSVEDFVKDARKWGILKNGMYQDSKRKW